MPFYLITEADKWSGLLCARVPLDSGTRAAAYEVLVLIRRESKSTAAETVKASARTLLQAEVAIGPFGPSLLRVAENTPKSGKDSFHD
jgi:hypothetical protein